MAQDDMKNFIASLNNTEDFVTFNETDRGEVNDWIPTMIPLMDKYLVGGIPISGQISEVFGGPSSGKSLSNSTLIPTPKGDKKISEIKVGDTIFDRLGKPTKVLGVFPQGKKEVYEVKLQDGRSIKVNDEHIWSVVTSRGNLKEKTTREMIDGGVVKHSNHPERSKHYRYQLPTNEWVLFDEQEVPIEPYVVGALLGDGCLTNQCLTMSSNDPFVVNKVASLIGNVTATPTKYEKDYNWYFLYNNPDSEPSLKKGVKRVQTSQFLEKLSNWKGLTNTRGKSIPDEYLYNSQEVRLELAQGLLDTDGSVRGNSGHVAQIEWSSVNETMAHQFANLLYSLGYHVSMHKQVRDRRKENKGITSDWVITITGNEAELSKLITLPRQLEKLKKCPHNVKRYDKVSIVSIKDLGYKEEMTCLYVDNLEHLFLAGDYIVTHNSTFSGLIMKNGLAMGVIPVYYDVEGTQNASRLEQLGVDTSRVLTKTPKKLKDGTVRPLSVESIGQNMIETAALIHNSKPEYLTLFIWDSIADTQSDMEADADMDQSLVGQQARALAKVGRKTKANFVENNAALLAFNQARADIGATNPRYAKTKTTGGNSWYHFLDTRILLSKGGKSSQVTKSSSDDEVIGYKTRVNIEKSKLGDNADAKFEVVLLTDTGFDTDYNIIVTGQDLGLISSGRSPKYEADNKEVITGRNVYDLYLKFQDPKNMEIKREIWQKECLYFFPECYPAIFNTTAVMHEKVFPLIKGLRKKYADIQEKLPVEKQAYNYKRFKSTKLPLDI